jgi:hypothetical protein
MDTQKITEQNEDLMVTLSRYAEYARFELEAEARSLPEISRQAVRDELVGEPGNARKYAFGLKIGRWVLALSENQREHLRKHGTWSEVKSAAYRAEFMDVEVLEASLDEDFRRWKNQHREHVATHDNAKCDLMLSIITRGDLLPADEAESEMRRLANTVGIPFEEVLREKVESDYCSREFLSEPAELEDGRTP